MNWTWRYEKSDGTVIPHVPDVAVTTAFPSQSDAESWVGEVWRELAEAGIDAVSLFEDERKVYGPMSLHPGA
jgi:hypothetical protein